MRTSVRSLLARLRPGSSGRAGHRGEHGAPGAPAPQQAPFPVGVPEMLEFAVQVGPYIGAAAMGGIIGNRADAGALAVATRMFRAARERWRRRRAAEDEPLSRDEAVEAATAAAITRGYRPDRIATVTAEQDPAGTWIVTLNASHRRFGDRDRLRVRVPPGDLADATLVVISS